MEKIEGSRLLEPNRTTVASPHKDVSSSHSSTSPPLAGKILNLTTLWPALSHQFTPVFKSHSLAVPAHTAVKSLSLCLCTDQRQSSPTFTLAGSCKVHSSLASLITWSELGAPISSGFFPGHTNHRSWGQTQTLWIGWGSSWPQRLACPQERD